MEHFKIRDGFYLFIYPDTLAIKKLPGFILLIYYKPSETKDLRFLFLSPEIYIKYLLLRFIF